MGDILSTCEFISDEGEFKLDNPEKSSYLYFPLANEAGIMSAITPTLNGDIKSGQNTFLMTPTSVEDLHNSKSSRNFWIFIENCGPWSAAGNSAYQKAYNFQKDSPETVKLEAGFLWHKIIRENKELGIKSEIINFAPVDIFKAELMQVTVTNTKNSSIKVTPTAAVPLYGRSADNIRDHRHVTSLLNRIKTVKNGIVLKPTLSFDERGHKINNAVYSVLGTDDDGNSPIGFFPEVEDFIGEGGSFEWPEAIVKNLEPNCKAGEKIEGYEAVGALRFKTVELLPGESKSYIIMMAINEDGNEKEFEDILQSFGSHDKFIKALDSNKEYWREKIKNPSFSTGDSQFDKWMKWVNLQPILRRIYGCSFLPHHDYGKGGRGWRDLWQDCLALLIMEPKEVRNLLLNNYAGVRVDGSNATIIGSKPGEFIADRNNIARIWMDHGAWPFLTTKLYLDFSGDLDFLLEKQTYFKDKITSRSTSIDDKWKPEDGNKQKTVDGKIYEGTILEHILIQNLTPFFNVGIHNNIRLEGADWNDGLDMAAQNGESAAFTAFYGSNLIEIAAFLKALKDKKTIDKILISEEMILLIDSIEDKINYNSVQEKRELLQKYFESCKNKLSGKVCEISIDSIAEDLKRKGDWILKHIREDEWIKNKEGFEWFNGYYDNDSDRVEGDHQNGVRINLTSQVFTIMGKAADKYQIERIIEAVNKYLKDTKVGGYRLNSNYNEVKTNLGRLYGFAFGHKENGAMFSHMAIMYGNALYKRGFAKEGYEVIDSIYSQCINFEKSRIYPGIPEYFNEKGRGMYNYLTGSASWLILTLLTESFGVKGELGNLVIEPKLLKDQFNENLKAEVATVFADRKIKVIYHNPKALEYSLYNVLSLQIDGEQVIKGVKVSKVVVEREKIEVLSKDTIHEILVELG